MRNRSFAEKLSIGHELREEKWLMATGLLGFLLAGICAVWVLLFGAEVMPGGDISKAFSFNAALGIFLLSTAVIMPYSAMGTRSKMYFRVTYIMLALYSYGAETIQNFRGVNPRFVQNGTSFDETVANGFALVAILLVVCYMFLAVQYFRRKAYVRDPEMVTAIRYAMAAAVISFAAGIWISINFGRFTGLNGNIIWLHGLGFHALQAVPLAAWLTKYSSLAVPVRRIVIHITGISYLLGLIAIGIITWNGNSVLEWSALQVAAIVSFAISLTAGAWVFCLSASGVRRAFIGNNLD